MDEAHAVEECRCRNLLITRTLPKLITIYQTHNEIVFVAAPTKDLN
jgi:hypothetical protein